ncbi:MAG: glycosyltransferase [Pseudomonadota bacterium]
MIARPEISLVIPTHNRAHLILHTIEAALTQTMPFAEILVIDDASTDDTLIRLRRFGQRIRVIESAKVGVQAARNLGVEIAASPYVTLCDSDDLLRPTFVETLSAWLAEHEEIDSVYVNYQSFDESGTAGDIMSGAPAGFLQGGCTDGQFVFDIPDLYARTVSFQPMMPTGATVKKFFYQAIGGFDPGFDRVPAEDWEYTLRAVAAGRTAICMTPLVLIRRHVGNDSRNLLRQALGEVDVLKFALKYHGAAQSYRDILLAGIRKRCHEVFYESFRRGQIGVAGSVFPLLERAPTTLRFKLKALLIRAYKRFDQRDAYTVLDFPPPKERRG